MKKADQICSRCIMDSSITDIRFDENGMCNYCTEFIQNSHEVVFKNESERDREREKFIQKIKQAGRKKRYDCVVGVSGGVDSSWALYQAVQNNLRPLAVHLDNGWDSEFAQKNIQNLVRKLKVDLYTHVIDWDEFRDLQQAFFDADVIDIELLSDNAIVAANFQQASRLGVRFILSGWNLSTEGLRLPSSWSWLKYDKRNIFAIWKRFGDGRKIKTFPALGIYDYAYFAGLKGIRWIPFLDYFDYKKATALDLLKKEFDYQPYPYKHFESIFTRFYQGYILPEKFGVDKRINHLSILILTGQITREKALEFLQSPPYHSKSDLNQDIDYFLKKMGWTKDQLDTYLKRPEVLHSQFPTETELWKIQQKISRFLKKLKNRT
jgi:N-acetyl sugar amidotransferase